MNTKIFYMYRDASNYKQDAEVVLEGEITEAGKKIILDARDEDQYFIPSQVGLCDLQERMCSPIGDDDHVWHELQTEDILATDDEPTVNHSFNDIGELVERFKTVKWDIAEAMKENGIKG